MAIEVETKDCTAVTDAELDELAALCAECRHNCSVGLLSKQTEQWVLLTTAHDRGKLRGFAFSTLERIGGTPSVIIGVGAVCRTARRSTVVRALMAEMYHRALMAFPDEDVIIGTRIDDVAGFELFDCLDEVVPRPGHRPSGEERAWGRRFAKRFGLDAAALDDRSFVVTGDASPPCVFDHEAAKPEKLSADVGALLDGVERDHGDHMVVFAWVSAEHLEKLGS